MSFVHVIEIFMILAVIILQFVTAKKIYYKIKRLKDLNLHDSKVFKLSFPTSLLNPFNYSVIESVIRQNNDEICPEFSDEIDLSEASLLYLDNDITECKKIIREVNTYMLKNDDRTVNFNIVQDIVERNFDVLDEEINQALPTTLYLGLAATMLGIIFGLWDMSIASVQDVSSIDSLIIGVGIAMVSSFIGVVLTTIMTTVFYKSGKKEADEEKNQFFSQLQADLLPELMRKGETGIEALNSNLERFSKIAEISVNQFEKISATTSETLKSQSRLINKIEKMNISKLTESSISIYERLENNLESFDKFAAYWEKLTQSIGLTTDLTNSLVCLVNKLSKVDNIANGIEQTMSEYNSIMQFFTAHINSFEDMGSKSKEAVALADIAFKDAISTLTSNANEQIEMFRKSGANIDIHLKDIGTDVADSLSIATKAHVEKLCSVYSEKMPAFEKLDCLESLPRIQNLVQERTVSMQDSNQDDNKKLLEKMDSLEKAILLLANNQKNIQKQYNKKNTRIDNDAYIVDNTPLSKFIFVKFSNLLKRSKSSKNIISKEEYGSTAIIEKKEKKLSPNSK